MFQLFYPIALFATAAVVIPVLIHLWNTQKGKTLKVGSIVLIKESSRKPARQFRVSNWPLLLLRCLLLFLLALLLSKPSWRNDKKNDRAGWILVADHNLAHAYQEHQPMIDSLLKEGYRLKDPDASQQEINLKDTAIYIADTKPGNHNNWSYIKYLNAILPAKFPVYIFSDDLSQDFAGDRPSLQLDFHWISLKNIQRADTTRAYSFTDNTGSIKSVDFISSANGNHYEESKTHSQAETETIASTHIGIYAGRNISDARYLKAAISAIEEYTHRIITVHDSPTSQPLDIIFWLQDTAPEEAVLKQLAAKGTFFSYGNSPHGSLPSNVSSINELHELTENDPAAFYRYSSSAANASPAQLLADETPSMTVETKQGQRFISFNSRFNPQWTDLVWKGSFVNWLLPVILPAPPASSTDLRTIDHAQAMPRKVQETKDGSINEPGLLNGTDLSFICWILVFVVFAAERILSHYQKNKTDG